MVISRRSTQAARLAASLLMEMIASVVKAAPLPKTANSQIGPELSAREASRSPVTNSVNLKYLPSFMIFLVSYNLINLTFQMLTSASDKNSWPDLGPAPMPRPGSVRDKAGGR
jgi:hypothetical protein